MEEIQSVAVKMQQPQLIYNIIMSIHDLDRYEVAHYESYMEKVDDGDYIKLKDVLAIFSAQNK